MSAVTVMTIKALITIGKAKIIRVVDVIMTISMMIIMFVSMIIA